MAFATLPGTLIHIDKVLEAIAQGNVADPALQIARVEFADKINKAAALKSIRQTLFLSIVVERGKRLNLSCFFKAWISSIGSPVASAIFAESSPIRSRFRAVSVRPLISPS